MLLKSGIKGAKSSQVKERTEREEPIVTCCITDMVCATSNLHTPNASKEGSDQACDRDGDGKPIVPKSATKSAKPDCPNDCKNRSEPHVAIPITNRKKIESVRFKPKTLTALPKRTNSRRDISRSMSARLKVKSIGSGRVGLRANTKKPTWEKASTGGERSVLAELKANTMLSTHAEFRNNMGKPKYMPPRLKMNTAEPRCAGECGEDKGPR